jgi:hypothetical protein
VSLAAAQSGWLGKLHELLKSLAEDPELNYTAACQRLLRYVRSVLDQVDLKYAADQPSVVVLVVLSQCGRLYLSAPSSTVEQLNCYPPCSMVFEP